MQPMMLALVLSVPAAPPEFTITSTAATSSAGKLTSLSLTKGVVLDTANGEEAITGVVSMRRADTLLPDLPTGAQLITAGGDRVPGEVRGGDDKSLQFRAAFARANWQVPIDTIAALWFIDLPADTPTDPARYTWLELTPSRDVLVYRNGDTLKGTLSGFTNTAAKFTPDGGKLREVEFSNLTAIGFNPRFTRVRKPKDPYAHLILDDGTRLAATEPAVKQDQVIAKTVFGATIEFPLAKIVALDVMNGNAAYLSDMKPKQAESTGFLGVSWPWAADRTVRGQPLQLHSAKGINTIDKGLGTHPRTILTYELAGKYDRFDALVGLDAATGKRGSAAVRIKLDDKELELPELKKLVSGPARRVSIDVRGAKTLTLVVDYGPTGDVQADVNWGWARLIASGERR